MDIALHRSTSDIEEDLEYYFSEQRDKHNQIRPSDDIRSFTTDSPNFTEDPGENRIGNVFHPFAPFSLDRIFIGISFPLFSNNWGAAFLRHLLELIKPKGAVILPVYPEIQARDQGLWCRSSLENIFRSRSRYIGISNIWAENDGVMSMRIGRRWPPVIPSTARWLFEQTPRRAVALGLEDNAEAIQKFWQSEIQRFWRLGRYHAVIEQIIRNQYGPRRSVRLAAIGEDAGLIALECLYSPYTRVTQADVYDSMESPHALEALDQACSTLEHGPLECPESSETENLHDVLCVTDSEALDSDAAVRQLAKGGTLILTPECAASNPELGSGFKEPEYYSDTVAQRLHPSIPIYHYSERIEEEIAQQTESHQSAFMVLSKA
ncbi:MAG: hypothetical protein OXG03_03205 [Gammaproteobacteria bacterium]|nr:hypothetical protein [Gammaproteobacteria bacterium]